jgi:rSAM/selenodomain-associated transferase 2/rSAM/selenodomain-associated transferase 1
MRRGLRLHLRRRHYYLSSGWSQSMPAFKRDRLIVFTRFPEPGKTKTRLIPALGRQGAAELQRQMTEHVISTVEKTLPPSELTLEVRHEGGSADLMRSWLGMQFIYRAQGSGDIGLRMARAFEEAFQSETERVVIIGSDIPGISADLIRRAFEELKKNDLVLGTAKDGGYYLIGMQRAAAPEAIAPLFSGIKWGSREVISQTLSTAKALGLRFALLEKLADVDRIEDLHVWEKVKGTAAKPTGAGQISIIIPTLNEAATIAETLAYFKGPGQPEVIVVDGGSQDDTVRLAAALGAKVIQTKPGKACQMNAGAAAAGGEVLVFLHADTRLPQNFSRQILAALNQNNVVAGAFRLHIDSGAVRIRLIEKVANWRSRYLKMPYGDQALFMKKALFQKIGGFAELPIMEDFLLVRRLKRMGRIIILPEPVTTSSRRWIHLGVLRTWLINQLIVIAYYLGISPERLSRFYRRKAGKGGR